MSVPEYLRRWRKLYHRVPTVYDNPKQIFKYIPISFLCWTFFVFFFLLFTQSYFRSLLRIFNCLLLLSFSLSSSKLLDLLFLRKKRSQKNFLNFVILNVSATKVYTHLFFFLVTNKETRKYSFSITLLSHIYSVFPSVGSFSSVFIHA